MLRLLADYLADIRHFSFPAIFLLSFLCPFAHFPGPSHAQQQQLTTMTSYSPNELPGLRSSEAPTTDLSRDPAAKDLSPSVLKQQLGGDFVPRYMSVSRPLESIIRPNGSFDYSNFHIPQDIKQLRFAKFPGKFGGNARQKKEFRKNIRQFLASYSFCPVKYKWTDYGLQVFPRWIRDGVCFNEPGQSCSIPPSNKCNVSQTQNLRLLRYHCQNWERGRFCRWISSWHQVVVACECKCKTWLWAFVFVLTKFFLIDGVISRICSRFAVIWLFMYHFITYFIKRFSALYFECLVSSLPVLWCIYWLTLPGYVKNLVQSDLLH